MSSQIQPGREHFGGTKNWKKNSIQDQERFIVLFNSVFEIGFNIYTKRSYTSLPQKQTNRTSQCPNRKKSQIFCHQVKSSLSICQHVPLTGYSLAGRRLRWSVVSQIGREELMAALRVSGLLCRHHPLMARILSAQDSVCSTNLILPLLSEMGTLPTKCPDFIVKSAISAD